MTYASLIEAFLVCIKHKRNTHSALEFEINYELQLMLLLEQVQSRQYRPGRSICFIVTRPRYREVFAASFIDRVIHHWIALRVEPLLESVFTDRTFNCRVGKGQLYGINTLKQDLFDCSRGYMDDCYIMQLDIQGFFMSIDRNFLADVVTKFIEAKYFGTDKDTLLYLCRTVITHAPELNCLKQSRETLWSFLAKTKSLFTNGKDRGLAIGNLFAQHFANLLLNSLDWYILTTLGFKYYGRYVDDFYLLHSDKNKLLDSIPKIRMALASLGLKLNERKFYLQHYSKGCKFLGVIVKPYYSLISPTTLNNFKQAVCRLNSATTLNQVQKAVSSINSYLGLLSHHSEYNNRKRILSLMESPAYEFCYIKGSYEVLSLKNKYKPLNY